MKSIIFFILCTFLLFNGCTISKTVKTSRMDGIICTQCTIRTKDGARCTRKIIMITEHVSDIAIEEAKERYHTNEVTYRTRDMPNIYCIKHRPKVK